MLRHRAFSTLLQRTRTQPWTTIPLNRYEKNSRGWTLQEKSLASRMIYLCQTRLVFEREMGSKSGVNLLVTVFTVIPFSPEDDISTWSQIPTNSTEVREADQAIPFWYKSWHIAVQKYSNKRLNQESDKLPAISGLASYVVNELAAVVQGKDQYLAGLWKNDLVPGLLWRVASRIGRNESTREATY